MGGTCSTHCRVKKSSKIIVGKPQTKNLGNLGIDFKWVLVVGCDVMD
jgi:hypothetical protein